MRTSLSYLLVVAITAILSIFAFSAVTDEESGDSETIHATLFSGILGEERELNIHLPGNYDSTRTYPVLYVLDGGSQDSDMAKAFTVLTIAGYSPETIVVGIPNMTNENRQRDLTPPYLRQDDEDINSKPGEADTFMLFMESELFPFIEKYYAASQTRLISGNSRGGLFVMYSLIHRPHLFDARFCFSAPVWRQDNLLVSKVESFLNTADTLNTFIYMSAGEKETDNIKSGMRNMARVLQKKAHVGLVLYAEHTPKAIHQNNAIRSFPKAIARWSEHVNHKLYSN